MNHLHSSKRNKLDSQEKVCINYDYCNSEVSGKDRNILKYHHGKSLQEFHILVYADGESLLEKTDKCLNIPEKHFATVADTRKTCRFSISAKFPSDKSEDKLGFYIASDSMDTEDSKIPCS